VTVSVILAHPNPHSFNHAIANAAAATLRSLGHVAVVHDLCAEKFDPLTTAPELDSAAGLPPLIHYHCEELKRVDGVIFVHPNWWGQPPAILKGWVDRVLRPGVAYKFLEGDSGEGVPVGLLKARQAVVFNTSNTTPERERAVFGDPLETIWLNCILGLCGVESVTRKTFSVVVTSTEEERHAWLEEVVKTVAEAFGSADGRKVRIESHTPGAEEQARPAV
jgi:NAD(P)H dehydrogenase (quinone)